jgi:hypothetical protein
LVDKLDILLKFGKFHQLQIKERDSMRLIYKESCKLDLMDKSDRDSKQTDAFDFSYGKILPDMLADLDYIQ